MDASNVVSLFVLSANQYALDQNEDNMKQFQRHLEILVCLTADDASLTFFENHTLSNSQCMTHVVNVLLDNACKQPLLTRALNVLQNLTNNNNLLRSLQLTYHVHSAVSTFLQQYGIVSKDNLVIQCLQLMESITYGVKIDYLENHLQNLIGTLFKLVLSESSQVSKMSLHILSNLCRHNPKVQVHVCSLPNFKEIFKKLVTMINTEAPNIILYSLSILSSVTPFNNLGAKLWTDEHLMLTFDLIQKLLICNDYGSASTAVDLFVDLIQVPRHLQCLTKCPNLNRCLRKVTKSLHKGAFKQCGLLLKFLYSLSSIADLKEKLLGNLCMPCENKQEQSSHSLKVHPKLTLWCIESKEVPTAVTVTSLKLIKSIVIFLVEKNFSGIEDILKDTLVNILENVCISLNQNEECVAIKQASFDLLSLLCKKTKLRIDISQKLEIEALECLMKCLLRDSFLENSQRYEQAVNLILTITETVSLLRDILPDWEVFLTKLLEDDKVMDCVTFALTSNDKLLIRRSISLLCPKSKEHSLDILCKSLLSRNADLQKVSSQQSDAFFPSNSTSLSCKRSKYSDSAFDSLMNKIENGLQIKDLKSSEIMDLYEHKIAMLTLKEQEFQSYIDAKTQALEEADRIITQYKCRQSDVEGEALRLRSMMKDYECRCEMSAVKCTQEEQRRKKLEINLDLAHRKIKEMEQTANEHREMTMSQITRLTDQKKNVEEEKLRLFEQIAVKDQEKKVLTAQLQQHEEELRLKNKVLEELQESKEDLIKVLDETKKSAEKSKVNFELKLLQLQNILDTAQQTIVTLEGRNEILINEMAKRSEEFSHKLDDLNGENEQLAEQLKLKDLKIEDMNEGFRKLNENLHEKSNIIQENELLLSKLRKDVEQLENQRVKSKQDKGMLELLCKKYEASIEEKDSTINKTTHELEMLRKDFDESMCESKKQIQHLKDELEKHKYITEMVHNITSGRGLPPKT